MQPNQNEARVKPTGEVDLSEEDNPANVPDRPPPVDARDDGEKLKENRENLGVDDEHKTRDMKEGHRGTFP